MTKKIIISLSLILALVCIFAVSAFAAEPTAVYVKNGGTGDGLSYDTPIGDIKAAVKLVGSTSCDVIVIGEYPISASTTFAEVSGNVTFKGVDGGSLTLSANMALTANSNENVYTFDIPVTLSGTDTRILYGSFNSVVFGKNFSVSAPDGGRLNFYGGMDASAVDCVSSEIPYSITVNAGTFNVFAGGSLRKDIHDYVGSVAAPITVTINGGTFGAVSTYPTDSHNKNYNTFSVSGMSILANDATLNINGGTFNCPVYVQGRMGTVSSQASEKSSLTASDRKYYAIDGDIKVNITGGTFNGGSFGAYYTQAAYTTVMRGDYTVKVTGGTFAANTLFDATQVVPYEGSDKKAAIEYTVDNIITKCFDVVNGKAGTDPEPIRVAFIGDSITEGYAATAAGVVRLTDAYPAKFLELCEAAGKEVVVGNFGIGAATLLPNAKPYKSTSAYRYYPEMLAYPMVTEESAPDIVFIALGTNDSSGIGGTNGAALEYQKNYNMVIDEMAAFDSVDKIFVTSAIYRVSSKPIEDMRMAAKLHSLQREVAEEYAKKDSRVQFVDLYGLTLEAGVSDYLFLDNNGLIHERLHPTHNGLALMGEVCYNAAFNNVYTTDYEKTEIYISDSGTKDGAGTEDDPISFIPYAFGLAAADKEVTIYVKGTFTYAENLFFPCEPSKLNLVGVGSDAKFSFAGSSFKFGTDAKIDNITLESTGSGGYILSCFNDIEITETVKTTGKWHYYLGYHLFSVADPKTTNTFDTVESASSDNDCTVIINGGTFNELVLGNGRRANGAPFGTHSGDITLTIGEGATVGSSTASGLIGQNYFTGTINATVNSWAGSTISEYAPIGSVEGDIVYRPENNSGKVNITLGDSVTSTVDFMGDFDGNGMLNLGDIVYAISYVLNGFDSTKASEYFGCSIDTLADLLAFIKRV